jgi:hypothetical protein
VLECEIGLVRGGVDDLQRLAEVNDRYGLRNLRQYGASELGIGVDLPERPADLLTPDGRRFLDDFVHVASVPVDLIDLPSAVTSYRTGR